MNKNSIFKLFSHCIPVKGAKNFIICDLQRSNVYFIHEEMYDIVTKHKNLNTMKLKEIYKHEYDDEIDETLNYLIKHDLVFFTDTPQLFPDLNLHWESSAFITNAIIEKNKLSNYSLLSVIKELENLNCQQIELRFYDLLPYSRLVNILELFNGTKIRNIYLYIKYNEKTPSSFLHDLLIRFQRIGQIFIHSTSKEMIIKEVKNKEISNNINYIHKEIHSNIHCGLSNEDFFSSNITFFSEAQQHNTCLNRKISIDPQGNIKNCPSMTESYGNIQDTTLAEALQHPDFKKYWHINKDQIKVCQDCEFRYICTDCRAYREDPDNLYSKPLKCGYNPYIAEWEEWSTNPLKQKAIAHYGMEKLVKK